MPLTRSGAFLGNYGATGAVIEYEWVPDPTVFSAKILYVKDELQDRSEPLLAAQLILQRDIEENFEGEHDPQGQPWKPWSTTFGGEDPATGKRNVYRGYADNLPAGHSGKILNWRGILKEAATSDAAFVQVSGKGVNDDSLYFDTGGLPPYWEWHQEGVEHREPGGELPQRRFLGMSDNAEYLITIAFSEWFDGVLEVATSPKGNLFLRGRNPQTGRFVSLS